MKLRKLLTIVIAFVCLIKSNHLHAQKGLDLIYDFCTDSDINSVLYSCYADTNKYFVMGATSTDGVSPLHGTLASFDYNGNLLWYKKLLSPGKYNTTASAKSIIKIDNDKYLLIGIVEDYHIDTPYTIWHPYLYEFNGNGDSVRYSILVDSFYLRCFNSVTSLGSILITVGSKTHVPNTNALWICKYDSTGNLLWQKEYMKGYKKNILDAQVKLSADKKSYLIAGNMYDSVLAKETATLVKLDTDGNLIWVKSIVRPYWSYNWVDIVTNPTGGYYFTTAISADPSMAPDSSFVYYGKLNDDGDTVWTRRFRGNFFNSWGKQIMWASDMQHLFILAAPYSDTKSGAMEIDTSGNVIWYRVYDHIPLPDAIFRGGYINGAWPTPDGRLLMVGTTNTDINAKYSWIIIADSNGCRSDNDPSCWPLSIPGVTKNTSVHIYPNPTSDMLHVDNIKTGTRLQLLDLYGRSLYINTATGTMALIDMSGLPVANYLLQLTDVEGTRSSYKVLKQ